MEHGLNEDKATAAKVQTFFAGLAAETRRPSFGDRDRDFLRGILLRAEEAGLYNPRETP